MAWTLDIASARKAGRLQHRLVSGAHNLA